MIKLQVLSLIGFTKKFLGSNSFAKAVPSIGPDKVSYLKSSLQVFCLDANGLSPNSATLAAISSELINRAAAGYTPNINPFDKYPVNLVVSVSSDQADIKLVALNIQKAFSNYCNNYSNHWHFKSDPAQPSFFKKGNRKWRFKNTGFPYRLGQFYLPDHSGAGICFCTSGNFSLFTRIGVTSIQ